MKAWADRHPNLATWLVLAVGMLLILGWSARDVGLNASQAAALGVATVALAGLCAWIIAWEADDADDGDAADDAGAAGVPGADAVSPAGVPPSRGAAPDDGA